MRTAEALQREVWRLDMENGELRGKCAFLEDELARSDEALRRARESVDRANAERLRLLAELDALGVES